MEARGRYVRWLVIAALVDWLIGRTLSRSAIFMPKSPPVLAAYRGLTAVSQVALALAGLLVLIGVGWLAWHSRKHQRHLLSLSLISLILLNLIFLFVAPPSWGALAYHACALLTITLLGGRAWQTSRDRGHLLVWATPAAALVMGELHHGGAALNAALGRPEPAPYGSALFLAGEGLVVLSAVAFGWLWARRKADRTIWVIAGVPALAFSALYFLNPALAGVLAVWSVGLTLYLPWPVYALALWMAGAAALACLRDREPAGGAILLLAAGGFAPQISLHLFMSLIALWLLAEAPEAVSARLERTAQPHHRAVSLGQIS